MHLLHRDISFMHLLHGEISFIRRLVWNTRKRLAVLETRGAQATLCLGCIRSHRGIPTITIAECALAKTRSK
jgi:hypothetical protein